VREKKAGKKMQQPPQALGEFLASNILQAPRVSCHFTRCGTYFLFSASVQLQFEFDMKKRKK
jgi:hypothetical protein